MSELYQFRLRGYLDPDWSVRLGEMTISHNEDGTTSLTGTIPDQAALYGLIFTLRDLGVSLISIQPVKPGTDQMIPTVPAK